VQGARTDFSADLGATTIRQNGNSTTISPNGSPPTVSDIQGATGQSADSTTGGLVKLHLTRTLSAAAKLTFSAGRDLTDASTSFSNLQGGAVGVIGTAPAPQTTDNYTTTYASVGWQYERNRTTLALSGRWEKDNYGADPLLDYTITGAEFRVERKLTHALTAEILGRYYKSDYIHSIVSPELGTAKYDNELIEAGLNWRHGRALEVKLRYEHSAQVTTGIYGYGENRVMLTVGYRPKPRQPESGPGAVSPGT
jgi:hypothetical protein